MDKELIERLAVLSGLAEAGPDVRPKGELHLVPFRDDDSRSVVEAFAALIAEECAKIAEETFEGQCPTDDDSSGYSFMGESSAEAIRAAFKP